MKLLQKICIEVLFFCSHESFVGLCFHDLENENFLKVTSIIDRLF